MTTRTSSSREILEDNWDEQNHYKRIEYMNVSPFHGRFCQKSDTWAHMNHRSFLARSFWNSFQIEFMVFLLTDLSSSRPRFESKKVSFLSTWTLVQSVEAYKSGLKTERGTLPSDQFLLNGRTAKSPAMNTSLLSALLLLGLSSAGMALDWEVDNMDIFKTNIPVSILPTLP